MMRKVEEIYLLERSEHLCQYEIRVHLFGEAECWRTDYFQTRLILVILCCYRVSKKQPEARTKHRDKPISSLENYMQHLDLYRLFPSIHSNYHTCLETIVCMRWSVSPQRHFKSHSHLGFSESTSVKRRTYKRLLMFIESSDRILILFHLSEQRISDILLHRNSTAT